MWVQLGREQIERLVSFAQDAGLPEVVEKLQHYLDLDANEAQSIARYRQTAKKLYGGEGELEFDDDAVVSGGTGNGAYVMGWRWIEVCDLEPIGKRKNVKLKC